MKRYIKNSDAIFAMSNVRGKYIKVEEGIPSSFYYSPRNSSHGPRVKPVLNPDKMKMSDAGTLKLCDDWKYTPGARDKKPAADIVKIMKDFFRKYLVMFLLVWDKKIDDPYLEDYFRGDIDFHEFVEETSFYAEYADELDTVNNVAELEQFCRKNNLVNFYGN